MNARPFAELAAVLALAEQALSPELARSGARLIACLRAGGKILTCGNGGSAADALHLAEELVGRYRADRPALAALCLAADPTALTCIANDYGFAQIFARQVEALGRPGDVLIVFSTSGNSPNILAALQTARAGGLTTILAGGKDGGQALALADHALIVPSATTARIQEVHTLLIHTWLDQIEAEVWPAAPSIKP
jgi:D-sedoheptulose 7-phosphate isomerase